METNITRRRVLQGAGAIGVAGVAGNAIVSASDDTVALQDEQSALRVAHASPDTPVVEVHVNEAGDAAAGEGETPTDDGGAGGVGGRLTEPQKVLLPE